MHKRYKTLLLKIFFFSLFCATTIAAPDTDTNELIALLNKTTTMSATFEHLLVNNKGAGIGSKTSGSMALKRPGKFRWEITKPNKQLLIISSNQSLLYDADLAQVVKRKINYHGSGNPATLLSNSTESLTKSFKIVKLKKTDPGLWFELTPKTQNNQETGYHWIRINFINGQLKAMHIADNLGQKSIIIFNEVKFNSSLPAKMFVLNPPPNTEIFDAD